MTVLLSNNGNSFHCVYTRSVTTCFSSIFFLLFLVFSALFRVGFVVNSLHLGDFVRGKRCYTIKAKRGENGKEGGGGGSRGATGTKKK